MAQSTRSGANGDCVEVAVISATDGHHTGERLYAVRDSKDPDGPALIFTPSEWEAFIAGVKTASSTELPAPTLGLCGLV
ncbi:DUF397 domain-containing protein [Microtetraspora malaysiensis]|uniref:DUF397 domain-containing protein n=1 Tax=Microtetraspora malaysiensis TaxID=161358 RepID=UPI000B30E192|nr:DUF397 domain-containing protein [Microtetraspora malaysiensis]